MPMSQMTPRDRKNQPPELPESPKPQAWSALVGVVATVLLFWLLRSTAHGPGAPDVAYSKFYDLVQDGKVRVVTLQGQAAQFELKAPEKLEGRVGRPAEVLLALTRLEVLGLLARGDGGRYVVRGPASSVRARAIAGAHAHPLA